MSGAGAPGGLPRWAELPVAALTLAACLPLLLVLALAVRLTSPGPALFRQPRVGRGGRTFEMLKLRTMRRQDPAAGGSPITAGGDQRITPLGRWLRASKLDELPELWNIVRGDLSFVGPRPEVPAMVDLEDPRWRRVLAVRPGLTDPVTLRLRNEEAMLAKVPPGELEDFYRQVLQPWKLDGYLEYVSRRSPASDLRLIWRTLSAIADPRRSPPPGLDEIAAGYRPP